MFRLLVVAAMFALTVPTLAMAQQNNKHHPPGKPGPRPMVAPHGPPPGGMRGPPRGPMRGPVGAQFSYRGHTFNRVHIAPFIYPPGFAYRRWVVGGVLPAVFLAPAYYYAGWASLGLTAPAAGFQWVRYGPDLLLVNVATGQVVDVAYGVFY